MTRKPSTRTADPWRATHEVTVIFVGQPAPTTVPVRLSGDGQTAADARGAPIVRRDVDGWRYIGRGRVVADSLRVVGVGTAGGNRRGGGTASRLTIRLTAEEDESIRTAAGGEELSAWVRRALRRASGMESIT